uniref:G domain-containing protein n=1 Tax=Amphimedon queenslandica TaxID=400682 RepID=A0A1X7TZC0_AMPQE
MATCQGSTEVIQSVEQDNSNFNEEEEKEIQEAILRLSQRRDPINILVIGPTGAGKSTLVNALLGDAVAEEGAGAGSVTSEVKGYKGKYEGIQLRVYDTAGFSDTRGKSGNSIVEEIAEANKFDLILICIRMDNRAGEGVRKMFKVLGKNLRQEMWERSIIVLTFANMYLQLGSIRKSPKNKAEIINSEIKDFQGHVRRFLSPTLRKETIDEIPFCIAGEEDDERKLPTTDDWLKELWDQCIKRSSEDAGNFLKLIAKYRIMLIEAGTVSGTTVVGAMVGGAIGGAAGTVVPVTGNIIGATTGAVIGGGIAAIITGIVAAVKRKLENRNQPPPNTDQED